MKTKQILASDEPNHYEFTALMQYGKYTYEDPYGFDMSEGIDIYFWCAMYKFSSLFLFWKFT